MIWDLYYKPIVFNNVIMRYDVELNLIKFISARVDKCIDADGDECDCVIIPIKKNNLYKSSKGVIAYSVALEKKPNASGQSHMITMCRTEKFKRYLRKIGLYERSTIIGALRPRTDAFQYRIEPLRKTIDDILNE